MLRDFNAFTHTSNASVAYLYHGAPIAGLASTAGNSGTLYAQPLLVPPGLLARIGLPVATAGSGQYAHCAFYRTDGTANQYPSVLLHAVGCVGANVAGIATVVCCYTIAEGTDYWAVMWTSGVGAWTGRGGERLAVFGYEAGLTATHGGVTCPYTGNLPGSGFPATFPHSGRTITGGGVPTFLVSYSGAAAVPIGPHRRRHGAETFLVASRYAVGGVFGEAGNTTLQVVPDQLYATPLMLPRATTIDGIFHHIGAVASGVIAQAAIYGVECLSLPLPGRILSQDSWGQGGGAGVPLTMRGYCSSLASGIVIASVTQAWAIGDRRLVWLAATWTGSAQVQAVTRGHTWAFFGYEVASLSAPFTHLVTSWPGSATLPNTYPAVWTAVSSTMPALGVRIVG